MKRCKIKVTVTRIYEADFEDTLACAEVFKALERDHNPTTIERMSGDRWTLRVCDGVSDKSVESFPE